MRKIFFLVFLLAAALFFPQSEVLAADCSGVGAAIYTTDAAGTAAGPIQNTPFNLEVSYAPIKSGSIYNIALGNTFYTSDNYLIQATEEGKMSSSGLTTRVAPGPYYFTLYSVEGSKQTEICRANSFTVLAAGTAAAISKAAPPAKNCEPNCTAAEGIPCGIVSGTEGRYEPPGNGIMTAIGCIPSEPRALIAGLLRYGSIAAGVVAFLLMILGALQMITAEGNPESIKAAQERFYSAIIGLLFIIFSVLLMQVIGVDILNLPGFKK